MIEKIIVVAPTTAVPISTGFAVALKVLPAPSFSSRNSFACSNFGVNPKFFLMSFSNSRDLFDRREFEYGLRVVRDRAIGIDRDRDRPHAQKAKRHKTKSKDRRRQHQSCGKAECADDDSRSPSEPESRGRASKR